MAGWKSNGPKEGKTGMKIMIIGSMTFAKEMIKIKKKLEDLGHTVDVPSDIEAHLKNPKLIDDLESDLKHSQEKNVLKECFDLLATNDAVLALNYGKNNIDGYIGTSVLMEIGLAYYLGKKIFILNPIPNSQSARWAHEVAIMQPKVIDGDLTKIK